MAEITSHIFLGKDISKEIDLNSKMIELFSIGPDAFFFLNKTKKLGYEMHRKKTYLFFKNYIDYIEENNLENNKKIICSLYGFLSHYVLDYMVHPFIFYNDHLDKNNHRLYEMSLSKIIIKNHRINPNNYNIFKELKYKNDKEIVKLLNDVIYKTYGFHNGGKMYYKCLRRLKIIYRLFRYDKYGIKKFLYKIIDKIFNKKIEYISFYNIKEVDMNFNHLKWNHPCDRKEIHNESLIELYNNSLNRVIKIIHEIDFNNLSHLESIIENRSYVTGKDCNTKSTMRFFS